MGPFINYSLHFVERCSIKVQCNRLTTKPPLICAFYREGGGGEGEKRRQKNWLGRHRDRLKIFDLGQLQR